MCFKTKTTEDFISQAIVKHGNRYDYSKTIYIKSKNKVCIICKIHGLFYQTPNRHLRGSGCPHCAKKNTAVEFIAKSQSVHGTLYDYSKVSYKNKHTPVELICKEHGSFFVIPRHHFDGGGCPSCDNRLNSYRFDINGILKPRNKGKKKKYQTEENKELIRIKRQSSFIEKSVIKHKNIYDYSKVFYINCKLPVEIICKTHGSFFQSPEGHERGHGCSKCTKIHNFSKVDWVSFAKDKVCTLYLTIIYDEHETFLKVGITSQIKLHQRLHQCYPKYKYKVITSIKGDANFVFSEEKTIQKEFKKHKYYPLKKFGGYTECFNINKLELLKERFLNIKRAGLPAQYEFAFA